VDNDENKKKIAAASFTILKSCWLYLLPAPSVLHAPFSIAISPLYTKICVEEL
jgi:hypothetical protein